MKNYQKLHYNNYYELKENGEYIAVSRIECFAKAKNPDESNQYKQRWYFDPEAGYAVRLPRNENSYIVSKRNAADLKASERRQSSQWSYIWADENAFDYDSDSESDPATIYEDIALWKELGKALKTLSSVEQLVISVAFSGLSESKSAAKLDFTRKKFRYHRDKAIGKLKRYFEEF